MPVIDGSVGATGTTGAAGAAVVVGASGTEVVDVDGVVVVVEDVGGMVTVTVAGGGNTACEAAPAGVPPSRIWVFTSAAAEPAIRTPVSDTAVAILAFMVFLSSGLGSFVGRSSCPVGLCFVDVTVRIGDLGTGHR
jgi:hypothetical protein